MEFAIQVFCSKTTQNPASGFNPPAREGEAKQWQQHL